MILFLADARVKENRKMLRCKTSGGGTLGLKSTVSYVFPCLRRGAVGTGAVAAWLGW